MGSAVVGITGYEERKRALKCPRAALISLPGVKQLKLYNQPAG